MINTKTLTTSVKKENNDVILADREALSAIEDVVLEGLYIYSGGTNSSSDKEEKIDMICNAPFSTD